jgi:DNA-binding PadR family transcriptional regulator
MSKTKFDIESQERASTAVKAAQERATDDDRELYSGLMRLHILHHAAQGPIYGVWMAEELAHHGYRISPGTLYPLLHGLEKKGYLKAKEKRIGKTVRREYSATAEGRRALKFARQKVRELFGELIENR